MIFYSIFIISYLIIKEIFFKMFKNYFKKNAIYTFGRLPI